MRSADALLLGLQNDKELVDRVKEAVTAGGDPAPIINERAKQLAETAKKETAPAYVGDKWVYRIVVFSLSFILLAVVVGIIALVMNNGAISIPEGLVAIGSAAVGALAGLFAPSPFTSSDSSKT